MLLQHYNLKLMIILFGLRGNSHYIPPFQNIYSEKDEEFLLNSMVKNKNMNNNHNNLYNHKQYYFNNDAIKGSHKKRPFIPFLEVKSFQTTRYEYDGFVNDNDMDVDRGLVEYIEKDELGIKKIGQDQRFKLTFTQFEETTCFETIKFTDDIAALFNARIDFSRMMFPLCCRHETSTSKKATDCELTQKENEKINVKKATIPLLCFNKSISLQTTRKLINLATPLCESTNKKSTKAFSKLFSKKTSTLPLCKSSYQSPTNQPLTTHQEHRPKSIYTDCTNGLEVNMTTKLMNLTGPLCQTTNDKSTRAYSKLFLTNSISTVPWFKPPFQTPEDQHLTTCQDQFPTPIYKDCTNEAAVNITTKPMNLTDPHCQTTNKKSIREFFKLFSKKTSIIPFSSPSLEDKPLKTSHEQLSTIHKDYTNEPAVNITTKPKNLTATLSETTYKTSTTAFPKLFSKNISTVPFQKHLSQSPKDQSLTTCQEQHPTPISDCTNEPAVNIIIKVQCDHSQELPLTAPQAASHQFEITKISYFPLTYTSSKYDSSTIWESYSLPKILTKPICIKRPISKIKMETHTCPIDKFNSIEQNDRIACILDEFRNRPCQFQPIDIIETSSTHLLKSQELKIPEFVCLHTNKSHNRGTTQSLYHENSTKPLLSIVKKFTFPHFESKYNTATQSKITTNRREFESKKTDKASLLPTVELKYEGSTTVSSNVL